MYVTYSRVSSKEQGDSKLSLEEQDRIQERFAGNAPIVARFREVDSGGNCDRPELSAALAACRKHHATLLVSTLDRLLRDTAFCCQLLDGDVPFVCCDMPSATREWIQIRAVFGEYGPRKGSERMKAAWRARKARPDYQPRQLSSEATAKSVATRQAKAAAARESVFKLCRELRDAGRSLPSIAAELTGRGFKTSTGKNYSPTAVFRVLGGEYPGAMQVGFDKFDLI